MESAAQLRNFDGGVQWAAGLLSGTSNVYPSPTGDRVLSNFTDDAMVAGTHCTVDVTKGTVDFKSGSPCGQCCACADGAGLDISIDVAQQ